MSESDEELGPGPDLSDPEDSMWVDFGKWLQTTRKLMEPPRSRVYIATAARLSSSTLATLEKGGRNYEGKWSVPSPDDITLIQLARALDVPLTEMFSRIGRQPPPMDSWVPPVAEPAAQTITISQADFREQDWEALKIVLDRMRKQAQ